VTRSEEVGGCCRNELQRRGVTGAVAIGGGAAWCGDGSESTSTQRTTAVEKPPTRPADRIGGVTLEFALGFSRPVASS
jgi:hypothetical protein